MKSHDGYESPSRKKKVLLPGGFCPQDTEIEAHNFGHFC